MSHGTANSDVLMTSEPSFYNNVGDQYSRIESAFLKYEDLYENEVNVPIDFYGVWTANNEITNGGVGTQINGDDALSAYQTWLSNESDRTISGVDAYQLWTGSDLEYGCSGPDEMCLYGLGYPDRVDLHSSGSSFHGQTWASSIMEGIDVNSYDGYDPDEVHERGIVSGHEYGHIYGRDGHVSTGCDSGGACTLMDSDGKDIDDLHFDFVADSEYEITNRFHNHVEWDESHH